MRKTFNAGRLYDDVDPDDIETDFGNEHSELSRFDNPETIDPENLFPKEDENEEEFGSLSGTFGDEEDEHGTHAPASNHSNDLIKCPESPLGCGGKSMINKAMEKNPKLKGRRWSIKDEKGKDLTQVCPTCKNEGFITESHNAALAGNLVPGAIELVKNQYPGVKLLEEDRVEEKAKKPKRFNPRTPKVIVDPSDAERGSGDIEDETHVKKLYDEEPTKVIEGLAAALRNKKAEPKHDFSSDITSSPMVESPDAPADLHEPPAEKNTSVVTHNHCGCDRRDGLATEKDIQNIMENAGSNGYNEGIKNIRRTVNGRDEQQAEINKFIAEQYKCKGDRG
jgi:hypothetical protein